MGDTNLTTIEVDPSLAAWGARNLKRAGYAPRTVWGDGLLGWEEGGPYQRIIATAAVRTIPGPWREQADHDAVILTPFNTLFAGGGLLKLRVRDGVASGGFVGGACYMWARGHRPKIELSPPEEGTKRSSSIDPEAVFGPWDQNFVLGPYLPDVSFTHRGKGAQRQVQLWDEAGTSVTVVNHHDWWRDGSVTVYGSRDLWDELVRAFSAWRRSGQPHFTRFGMTSDEAGERVWLDEPTHVLRGLRTS